MSSDSGDKTEEPTPEKLRKLREEGNIPKSQDVTMAVSFLGGFFVLAATWSMISGSLKDLFFLSLQAASQLQQEPAIVPALLYQSMQTLAIASAPVLLTAMVLGVAINVAQVGFLFTMKPITPDLNKVNPVNGFKNLINGKKFFELFKTMVKFTIVSWLAWVIVKDHVRDLALLVRSDLMSSVKITGDLIWELTTKVGGAFALIAAADYFYQRHRFMKDNRMSKYDVKQEYKQSEGDPHHKAERKRLHQEILHSAGPAAVKDADVIVRNPDHIAVALKYDKEGKGAPKIVAKGTQLWAQKILEEAKRYNIPVVRNIPLAQALNKLDIGEEIPEELYQAVAEVLTFIYNLAKEQEAKQKRHLKSPAAPAKPKGPMPTPALKSSKTDKNQ